MFGKNKEKDGQADNQADEAFRGIRISTITFNKDRLPMLKELLDNFKESKERDRQNYLHDQELKDLMKPLAMELHYELRSIDFSSYDALAQERLGHILAAYSGHLLSGLQKIKREGWDGQGLLYNDYASDYRWDAHRRLEALVSALEAGGESATLCIPENLADQYEVWLISTMEYNLRKSEESIAKSRNRNLGK